MKKLLVICFHSVIFQKGKNYYKPAHGNFINELSEKLNVSLLSGYKEGNLSDKEKKEASFVLNENINILKTAPMSGGFYRHPIALLKKSFTMIRAVWASDVVHVFAPSYSVIPAALLTFVFRKKMTVFFAGNWNDALNLFYSKPNKFSSLLFSFAYWLSKKASHIIFVTNEYEKSIHQGSSTTKNIFVTRPLVMNKSFTFLKERKELKEKKYRIVFLGEVNPNKNIEMLIKAIANLLPTNNIHIDIIGDSNEEEYKSYLKSLSISLKVDKIIKWHKWIGSAEELRALLIEGYALVLPSKTEGFPSVVYEAQSCLLPVIISNLPNYKDMLIHNENALLFDLSKQQELENCISSLIMNKKLYSKISTNGWMFAKEHLSVSAAKQYLQAINLL